MNPNQRLQSGRYSRNCNMHCGMKSNKTPRSSWTRVLHVNAANPKMCTFGTRDWTTANTQVSTNKNWKRQKLKYTRNQAFRPYAQGLSLLFFFCCNFSHLIPGKAAAAAAKAVLPGSCQHLWCFAFSCEDVDEVPRKWCSEWFDHWAVIMPDLKQSLATRGETATAVVKSLTPLFTCCWCFPHNLQQRYPWRDSWNAYATPPLTWLPSRLTWSKASQPVARFLQQSSNP